MSYSPIVLFVYNRLWHTQQTVEALQKNKLASESELFIYSDGAKGNSSNDTVDEVRRYLKSINGFKKITIIERKENWGLANSIIDGVTKIVNKYSKIIVLEDDMISSPYFLQYMNDGLSLYKNENKVASIQGYVYPISDLSETFFLKGSDCWGWGTWDRAWSAFEIDGEKLLNEVKNKKLSKQINFNNSFSYTGMLKDQILGKNDSWAVRWYISTFLKDMLALYPSKSFIQNIGQDDTGTHCLSNNNYEVNLLNCYKTIPRIKIEENLFCKNKFEFFYNSLKKSLLKRIKLKLIKYVNEKFIKKNPSSTIN